MGLPTGEQMVYASMPALVALQQEAHGFSFLPTQSRRGPLAGRFASRLRGRGLDFEELRHYQYGDDIRYLDWKATRRLGRPHVRVFSEERDRPVILVVDQRMSMFFGSTWKMKSLIAAELAALAAWRAKDSGDRVGAIIFDETSVREIKPRRHGGTLVNILSEIVDLNNTLASDQNRPQHTGRLNHVLGQAARIARHDAILLVISDLQGWSDETSRHLTRIARHNDVVVSLIHDPLERDLPHGHVIAVSDGSLQIQIDTKKDQLRREFSDTFDSKVSWLENRLARVGVPVIPVTTVAPVADQLRKIIGIRT